MLKSHRYYLFLSLLLSLVIAFHPNWTTAELSDPLDSFSLTADISVDEGQDLEKTPQELINEAELLLQDDRPLDARTKLLRALRKDPQAYRAHILLAGYYLSHVGHFRLALRYVRQAQLLFEQQKGPAPYSDPELQGTHAQLLYLLAHIRLNLDNYQGALEVLDLYSSFNYFGIWYPSTRAWVLMKLGRMAEAVRVARLGVLMGAEPGRTLNMLGILLSMTGERESALRVFGEAVEYELALGKLGSPATPINNAGEVYKEMFQEDRAESFWLRATSLPDGCEHVLPAINISLLYIEQTRFLQAKQAIDNFKKCIAQFPLRNSEEHRALTQLIMGRLAYHSGDIDKAIELLLLSLENRQWFGKIGTNLEDLQSAAKISLAQALRAKRYHLAYERPVRLRDRLKSIPKKTFLRINSWWRMRRARQMLIEDLNNIEDLYIRNTDSMIEYPTFGTALAGVPLNSLKRRIEQIQVKDKRPAAQTYYQAYLAEALLARGQRRQGLELIDQLLQRCRPVHDNLLKIHLLCLKLSQLERRSAEYSKIASQVYTLLPATLRNYGLRLPATFNFKERKIRRELERAAFIADSSGASDYLIDYRSENGQHLLVLNSTDGRRLQQAVGDSIPEAVNLFTELVFSQKLGD